MSDAEAQIKAMREELAKKEALLAEKNRQIEQLEKRSRRPEASASSYGGSESIWSDTEHELFLTALEKHGDGDGDVEDAWDAIAKEVGTRGVEEVKLHAHEYFFKLQNERTIIAASHNEPAGARGGSGQDSDETWSAQDVASFEQGLAAFDESLPDRGGKLQQLLPHKSQDEIMKRYQKLLMQITAIEAGPVPIYHNNEFYIRWKEHVQMSSETISPHDTEGIPWSEEEHRLFLVGVSKFGREDYDNISQHYVVTRSADQVATFAFKYFARIDGARREKIRPPPLKLEFAGDKSPSSATPVSLLSPTASAAAAVAAVEESLERMVRGYDCHTASFLLLLVCGGARSYTVHRRSSCAGGLAGTWLSVNDGVCVRACVQGAESGMQDSASLQQSLADSSAMSLDGETGGASGGMGGTFNPSDYLRGMFLQTHGILFALLFAY